MTTDLRQLMQDTATDAPETGQLISRARLAAHRTRRRRRVLVTATAGTALGAVGVFARAGLPGAIVRQSPAGVATQNTALGHQEAPADATAATSPAVNSKPDCDGAYGVTPKDVPPAQLPARYLSSNSAYPLDWVQSAVMTRDCLLAPAALVLTDSDATGLISRAVTVWGPRAHLMSYANFTGGAQDLTVRGVKAQLVQIGTAFRLGWSEPGHASWEVTAAGLTRSQLLSLVEALRITDNTVSLPTTTLGLSVQTVEPPLADASDTPEWSAYFRTKADSIGLRVTPATGSIAESVSFGEPKMWQFVTVRGHRGVALTKDAHLVNLTWDERPGVRVSVNSDYATTAPAELAAFAENVQEVPATDPRIAAKLRSALGDASPPPTLASVPPATIKDESASPKG